MVQRRGIGRLRQSLAQGRLGVRLAADMRMRSARLAQAGTKRASSGKRGAILGLRRRPLAAIREEAAEVGAVLRAVGIEALGRGVFVGGTAERGEAGPRSNASSASGASVRAACMRTMRDGSPSSGTTARRCSGGSRS